MKAVIRRIDDFLHFSGSCARISLGLVNPCKGTNCMCLFKAYFNICTGGAFAPPGPLLAPSLRKNCPTSNWAHLKKIKFYDFLSRTQEFT